MLIYQFINSNLTLINFRYNICGANNSHFLKFSIGKLLDFVNNCKKCSGSIDDSQSESPTNESTDNENPSTNKNTTHCSNCNNGSDQLEQLFNCLFGYSKKYRVKFLVTHKVEKIDLTLENSLNVYRYFKPNELPEYDSKKDKKIGSEVQFDLKINKI